MITVTITKNASNEYCAVQLYGHAGYARSGRDIVCAAVSVLVINTFNSIEAFTEDKKFMEIAENEKEGFIHCRFLRTVSRETALLLDAMVLGLQGVQEQYSKKYMKLIFEEV